MTTRKTPPAAKKAPGKKAPAKKAAPNATKAGTAKDQAAERRAIFIEAYIANGRNATEAAITAGYSPATAYQAGYRLLKDVEIKQQLDERSAQLAQRYQLTTDRVLEQLGKIVYADIRKAFDHRGALLPIQEIPEEVAHTIASIEVDALYEGSGADRIQVGHTQKVKFNDKGGAIDKAMKYLGLFHADNKQRSPFETMTPEQLDSYIEFQKKRIAEAGG